MESFTKVVRIGLTADVGNLFAKIEYKNGRLSITGVEGPKSNGNCLGGCGQIDMHEWHIKEFAPGWNHGRVTQFRAVWDEWHLNDMKAGSPAQTQWLKENNIEGDYSQVCKALTEAGINPDPNFIHNGKPYKYGSAWLSVHVPIDVLEFLQSLPDTDIKPAWV